MQTPSETMCKWIATFILSFSVVLPTWAANNSNTYKFLLSLEEFGSQLAEQAEVIENLNRIIIEQGQVISNYKNTTEALNRTIIEKEAELNMIKAGLEALNKSMGELNGSFESFFKRYFHLFVCSNSSRCFCFSDRSPLQCCGWFLWVTWLFSSIEFSQED